MFIVVITKSLMIFAMLGLVFLCRRAARKEAKRTMYSYRIVSLIGVMIFLIINMILQLIRLGNTLRYPEYVGFEGGALATILNDITSSFFGSVFLALLPGALFSLFLLVANIVLFIKEGCSLRNALGILLGVALCFGSLGVLNLYNMLDLIFNVHSYAGYCLSIGLENVFGIIIVYFECLMGATIYAGIKSMKHRAELNKEYVIVLGCYVRPDGMPGGVLRERVEAAMGFTQEQQRLFGETPTLVFSGGKGGDETVSEAEAMKNYVKFRKYRGRVLLEEKSRTTQENFKFSRKVIEGDARGVAKGLESGALRGDSALGRVAFATTDFHVFRSGVLASQLGFEHPEGIPAKSPWYFYYNALIREFVANLNAERKIHMFSLLFLTGFMSAVILLGYVFDLL